MANGGDGLCHAVHDRGGSCNGSMDCLAELTCNQPDAEKPGTCAVYGLPGDPCGGNTTVCRPGGVCDGTQCKPVDSLGLFKNACLLGATN